VEHGTRRFKRDYRAPYGQALTILRSLTEIDTDECVEWPYCLSDKGYGMIRLEDRKTRRTHNLTCEWHHGPKPADKTEAAHSCGNRSCVNPRHLRWATAKENAADRITHGTNAHGERMGGVRLTEAQVAEIKELLRSGQSYWTVAKRYPATPNTIRAIALGRTWRHVA
jgi:hypothetical protein